MKTLTIYKHGMHSDLPPKLLHLNMVYHIISLGLLQDVTRMKALRIRLLLTRPAHGLFFM